MDSTSGHFMSGLFLNGRYETLSPLNHGSFGVVSLARDSFSGKLVALKCLLKPTSGLGVSSPTFAVDDKSEELAIHSHIAHHPHIVNLLDSFDTPTHSYLVLEYCCNGDLYEAIRQDKGPKETEHVRAFMHQLLDAIEYLHQNGIYHRDIKPENIFLTEMGDMKIGDFGLATTSAWSYESAVGSDRYMSPEQYDPQGSSLSPARADIWSVGICLLNILFSRNPFGVPALSDPLFSDYVRDRQSLFDVFPNMSQDTFEVLVHALAIDPEKRSLSMMRNALDRVVSFTTDDETLDDFCTGGNLDVITTANREPFRTPSICSPNLEADAGHTFNWSQALHMTSPKQLQRMDMIEDNESYSEELFPGSESSAHDWTSKAETQSIESIVDSGLGVSLPSAQLSPDVSDNSLSKPMPITASLPAFSGRASKTLSSIFGRKKTFESKSWSDLWDEDEEERLQAERERTMAAGSKRVAQLSQADSESSGRSTPRACLAELKNFGSRPVSRASTTKSVKSRDAHVSQQTGFVFEDTATPTKYSAPGKRSYIMDKWAALGEKRRAQGDADRPFDKYSVDGSHRRFSPANWRRNFGHHTTRPATQRGGGDHKIWQRQDWNRSTNWRSGDQNMAKGPSPLRKVPSSQLDGSKSTETLDRLDDSSENEAEWVGGFKMNDLHL